MLRSDLCDYSDVYIVVKGTINLRTSVNDDMPRKDAALTMMHHSGHAF